MPVKERKGNEELNYKREYKELTWYCLFLNVSEDRVKFNSHENLSKVIVKSRGEETEILSFS